MTDISPSPIPTDRQYFASLETKLIEYFDKRLGEIKDEIHQLALSSASKNEVASIAHQMNQLQSQSDVNTQRIRALETEAGNNDKDRRARPVQVWQIVVGAFSVLAVLMMCANDGVTMLFQFVNLFLLFKK